MSNDNFMLGPGAPKGYHGTRILGQNPDEEFGLQIDAGAGNMVIINAHPNQTAAIIALNPMDNDVIELFNCFLPITLRILVALDKIGEYMEF